MQSRSDRKAGPETAADRPVRIAAQGRRRLVGRILAMTALLSCTAAFGQTYPSKPVHLIVPYAVGGATDVTGRLIGSEMAKRFGQPVIVENRVGAGGALAGDFVAKANPDGYTVCFCGIAPAVVQGILSPNLPYKPLVDLAPVGRVLNLELILVASNQFPGKSVADVIAMARSSPGKLSYGHSGAGNTLHLAGELFKNMAGVDIAAIAYKGDPQLLNDVVGEHLPLAFTTVLSAAPLIKNGRVRALAVTGRERSRLLPDIPTMSEAGVPDFTVDAWIGMNVPAATPAPVVARLNAALLESLQDPTVRESLYTRGMAPAGTSPQEYGAFLKSENAKWTRLIREARIRAE